MALVLGPVLRHVGDTTATVWVQTEHAADVEVLGCRARTFEVHGCHFALVVVDGLTPDSATQYEVAVDGAVHWPEPDSGFPPSIIRTRGPQSADHNRVVFGSCRFPRTDDPDLDAELGIDALDSYATRLAEQSPADWPDALLLLGDQVYADELTPHTRRHLAGRRATGSKGSTDRPDDEVISFDEYAGLYRHTWGDPEIRWILSTVPTAMIFDDHDIRDDWNTSATWRQQINREPWWRERIRAGLVSYWVFQHIGNLTPAALTTDPDYQAVLGTDGDCWDLLVALADRADTEIDGRKGLRFSFRWDLGRGRLIMVDSRNGRVFADGTRKMLSDNEFDWLDEQMNEHPEDVDHVMIGSSLPWLLPPVLGDAEAVNEIAAQQPGVRGRIAEKIRQGADLEHWQAFGHSFRRLTTLIGDLATRPSQAPATITVLSGDVHHSYAARVAFDAATHSDVYQLVCSPVHNKVPAYVKPMFIAGWSSWVARVTRRWARHRGAPQLPMSWTKVNGPIFGNTIATLELSGRSARAVFEQPGDDGELATVSDIALTTTTTHSPTTQPVTG
ncbi:alkaline phosphatase D family protein [Gordonia sp. Z-3]|jgi:phosphodiesterase/alkaline phosphatase D-like protein|uniref:alkaline phosphatase D family protein n=1 Tax=Gordonia sp. Z-3 TaxID=3115408 RepID=UPI002E2824A6|nr:alkaline phosphatase D family protein [Gordonia sp. Z-3]MED5801836.1 alkaline phosphatase D family protein [Gordonia sp. Z-3]